VNILDCMFSHVAGTYQGRARQSSLASCPWAHPFQGRRTDPPCSERQCTWVPLILYFTRVANVPSILRLRSSNSDRLMVPFYNLTAVCKRAFPVFAANLWNRLPVNLTSAPSLTIFRQRLKTYIFRRSYPDLIIWHSDL